MQKITNCGIYKITNSTPNEITGLCKVYVGSSVNLKGRKRGHFNTLKVNKHHNVYLQNAYNKYGESNFEWTILEYVEFDTDKSKLKSTLLEREQFYLDNYKDVEGTFDKDRCYNLCPNAESQLGLKRTEEFCRKLHVANKGKKLSAEHVEKMRYAFRGGLKALWRRRVDEGLMTEEDYNVKVLNFSTKLSKSLKGHVVTNETKDKIRKANTGYKVSEETKQKLRVVGLGKTPWNKGIPMREDAKQKMIAALLGKPSWNKGIPMREESKKKLSLTNTGRKASEETKKKMSDFQKGRVTSEETKKKLQDNYPNKKSVINLTTGEIFSSVHEAARAHGIKSAIHICDVCKGKQKTCNGYKWAYYTESEEPFNNLNLS